MTYQGRLNLQRVRWWLLLFWTTLSLGACTGDDDGGGGVSSTGDFVAGICVDPVLSQPERCIEYLDIPDIEPDSEGRNVTDYVMEQCRPRKVYCNPMVEYCGDTTEPEVRFFTDGAACPDGGKLGGCRTTAAADWDDDDFGADEERIAVQLPINYWIYADDRHFGDSAAIREKCVEDWRGVYIEPPTLGD
jgi:hypothetical protein